MSLSQCKVLHITEHFIEFAQFRGIILLFTATSALIFLKTNLKHLKKLSITCDLLLQIKMFIHIPLYNYFCNYICHLKGAKM